MTDIAIRVEGLSKHYRLGGKQQAYRTLRESLAEVPKAPLRFARTMIHGTDGESANRDHGLWALKDISFEVNRGEVVGVIGPNGSGKSTLLKILTQITEPTAGQAEIHGRVSSLLEVGSGFHAELTGRENIFLNGAILGMHRAEIERKFDEIVAFAEVERFIDTPVKKYSSGMYLRLAFAVAAHLEPDILLVDEVLAVGDIGFQNKCLGKMGEVAKQGRTILFVSHNMAAVEHLCSRTLLLKSGRLAVDAPTYVAIAEYLTAASAVVDTEDLGAVKREPDYVPIIRKVEFLDRTGRPVQAISSGNPLTVRIYYQHSEPLKDPFFSLSFETAAGVKVFLAHTRSEVGTLADLPPAGVVTCHFPRIPLLHGNYFLTPGCGAGPKQLDLVPRGLKLQVIKADFFGTGRVPRIGQALVLVDANWQVTPAGEKISSQAPELVAEL